MKKRLKLRDLVLLLTAGAFVATKGHDTVRASLGEQAREAERDLADAMTLASDPTVALANPERAGRHLGFDTYAYPGDAAMRAWRHRDVPYEWVGYYLPAPCHRGTTWSGKRERLEEMGWGMAVIYVGQQAWEQMGPPPKPAVVRTSVRASKVARGKAAKSKRAGVRAGKRVAAGKARLAPKRKAVHAKRGTVGRGGRGTARLSKSTRARRGTARRTAMTATQPTVQFLPVKNADLRPIPGPVMRSMPADRASRCARPLLHGNRGVYEADDAIARTAAEGFPHGSVIFLDIERMERVPGAMRDYYKAWTARVLADGRYRPGYYVHKHNAELIHRDVQQVYTAAGVADAPPFWIASGRNFHQDRRPQDVGHQFAGVWQGVLDVVEEWNGVKLPIDVNVASVPSPSSHVYAAGMGE